MNSGTDAGLIVIFQETHLVIILRIHRLLEVHQVQPVAEGSFSRQIAVEALPDIIFIFQIKSFKIFRIPVAGESLPPGQVAEALMHGFRQPDAAGMDFLHRRPRFFPEFHRHEGRHVTPESVHNPRPALQGFDLVIPEPGHRVIQIDHIRPVADLVAGFSLPVPVIKFGVLLQQDRIRGGMIIHHIDDAFHSAFMDCVHQRLKIRHRSVFRIHIPVIPVGVGAAEAALLPLNPDGMDRHQPDDIRPQLPDPVQIRNHGAKASFLGMGPHINRINHLLLQVPVRIGRHDASPSVSWIQNPRKSFTRIT